AAIAWYYILKHGGLKPGGLNFDAKVRRGSVSPIDRIRGHILALDTYGAGLRIAAELRADLTFRGMLEARYRGWQTETGRRIDCGGFSLDDCRDHILTIGDTPPLIESGQEEVFEHMLNAAQARAYRKM